MGNENKGMRHGDYPGKTNFLNFEYQTFLFNLLFSGEKTKISMGKGTVFGASFFLNELVLNLLFFPLFIINIFWGKEKRSFEKGWGNVNIFFFLHHRTIELVIFFAVLLGNGTEPHRTNLIFWGCGCSSDDFFLTFAFSLLFFFN